MHFCGVLGGYISIHPDGRHFACTWQSDLCQQLIVGHSSQSGLLHDEVYPELYWTMEKRHICHFPMPALGGYLDANHIMFTDLPCLNIVLCTCFTWITSGVDLQSSVNSLSKTGESSYNVNATILRDFSVSSFDFGSRDCGNNRQDETWQV